MLQRFHPDPVVARGGRVRSVYPEVEAFAGVDHQVVHGRRPDVLAVRGDHVQEVVVDGDAESHVGARVHRPEPEDAAFLDGEDFQWERGLFSLSRVSLEAMPCRW